MTYPIYFVEHKTSKGWEVSREFDNDRVAALDYFENYMKYQVLDRTSTTIEAVRMTQVIPGFVEVK